MNTITDIDLAASIVNRWNHVLNLEWQARRGDEKALRSRLISGARNWLL